MKKEIICWKITNEMSGESWNFINLTYFYSIIIMIFY